MEERKGFITECVLTVNDYDYVTALNSINKAKAAIDQNFNVSVTVIAVSVLTFASLTLLALMANRGYSAHSKAILLVVLAFVTSLTVFDHQFVVSPTQNKTIEAAQTTLHSLKNIDNTILHRCVSDNTKDKVILTKSDATTKSLVKTVALNQ